MPMKLTSSIITTPYEKVLQIIKEAKSFINMMSKNQTKLIRNLEWVIKVITSHSLYRYELKENEMIEKYSKENPNFKQFVDFVYEYNEEVIEMNKKKNIINSQSVKLSNDLLSIPSFKLKRNKFNVKSSTPIRKNKVNKKSNSNSFSSSNMNKMHPVNLSINSLKGMMKTNPNNNNINNNNNNKNQNLKISPIKNSKLQKFQQTNNLIINPTNNVINFNQSYSTKEKSIRPFSQNPKKPKFENSFNYIEICIQQANFSPKQILEKNFDIFELKKIIGHTNVLPLMGKTILEAFGLVDESIISINKLEKFLYAITNQYLTTTLYHNSMHGADVTHTVCLFFLNSNAEKVCSTNVLDLLSILIASLGHDIGHPGLTNNFQINSLSEMALTYNDISCLENFHLCKLFKTIKQDENNIFEKLNNTDFKTIRKRMISEILATDMANHGKVMTVIKARIPNEILEGNKDIQFELLSKNPKTQFEEQQSLLDFFIHAADLAHNTKLFKISLQWVELLSNEFWIQGDKEKELNLPVSFLCERIGCNVPSSQVGFIKGFILPTFEVLIMMFPTLSYTVENAKINIGEWQKLVEQKRMNGWTPRNEIEDAKDENNNNNEGNIITGNESGNNISNEEENGISKNENDNYSSLNTNVKNNSNNYTPNNNDNRRHLHHNSDNGGNGFINENNNNNNQNLINKKISNNDNKKKNSKSFHRKGKNSLQYSNTAENNNFINSHVNTNNNNIFHKNNNLNIYHNVSPFKLNDIQKSYTTNWANAKLLNMKKNNK